MDQIPTGTTATARGIAGASSTIPSWATWLCDPPAATRVSAVTSSSRSGHAGSGVSIYALTAVVISQSKVSPLRPGPEGALPGPWQRNVLQYETVHTPRMLLGEQVRDDPTHGVADDIHRFQPERIEATEDVVRTASSE